MEKYKYLLLKQIREDVDVRYYKDGIAKVIKAIGGKNLRVFRSGYSFEMPRETGLTHAEKRELGSQIAKIPGLGANAVVYNYRYKSGKAGISVQLFRIDE